jgi:hypothetical protein
MRVHILPLAVLAAAGLPSSAQMLQAPVVLEPFKVQVVNADGSILSYPSVEGVHGLAVAKLLARAGAADPRVRAVAGKPNFSFTHEWNGDPTLSLAVAHADASIAQVQDSATMVKTTALAAGNGGSPSQASGGATVTVGLNSPPGFPLAMQFGRVRFNEWLLFVQSTGDDMFVAETARFSYGTQQIINLVTAAGK